MTGESPGDARQSVAVADALARIRGKRIRRAREFLRDVAEHESTLDQRWPLVIGQAVPVVEDLLRELGAEADVCDLEWGPTGTHICEREAGHQFIGLEHQCHCGETLP
jgi:hypothetical protein